MYVEQGAGKCMGSITAGRNPWRFDVCRSLHRKLEGYHCVRAADDVRHDLAQAPTPLCVTAIMRRISQRNSGDNDEFEITGKIRGITEGR